MKFAKIPRLGAGSGEWVPRSIPFGKHGWLEMDGWNTTFLLGRPIFRGYVSFREGISVFPIQDGDIPLMESWTIFFAIGDLSCRLVTPNDAEK